MSEALSFRAAGGPPLTALVVDPVTSDLAVAVSTLSLGGFAVTTAANFEQAKNALAKGPNILVTALRLGEYNGLHLVLRGKAQWPELAAVIIAPSLDPVLRAEADALSATFVVAPTTPEHLLAAVLRTVERRGDAAAPIRPPFERRERERRTTGGAVFTGAIDRRTQDDRRRGLPLLAHGVVLG